MESIVYRHVVNIFAMDHFALRTFQSIDLFQSNLRIFIHFVHCIFMLAKLAKTQHEGECNSHISCSPLLIESIVYRHVVDIFAMDHFALQSFHLSALFQSNLHIFVLFIHCIFMLAKLAKSQHEGECNSHISCSPCHREYFILTYSRYVCYGPFCSNQMLCSNQICVSSFFLYTVFSCWPNLPSLSMKENATVIYPAVHF
jgi:hypothetical protein